MINITIKKGDWFQFDDALFKVYECPPDATIAYMYQMIYENAEYIEAEMYQFSLTFIHLYMKPYKPYQEEPMKKKLSNAIRWFDEMVHSFGLECETATFIHNMLVKVYTESQADGKMLWDKEMIEQAYPVVIADIKQEQIDEILNIIRNDVPIFIGRRIKDGK